MAIQRHTGIDKEGEMMITEYFKCDRCGKDMGETPWMYVHTHSDVYLVRPASTHLCKECAEEFSKWVKKGKVRV